MDIGKSIRELRKRRGFNQIQLSEKSGITQTYLSQIESGLKNPTEGVLERIGLSLGIDGAMVTMYSLEEKDLPEYKSEDFKTIRESSRRLVEEIVDGHANS